MPVIPMGQAVGYSVDFLLSSGYMLIYGSLCIPSDDNDRDYMDNLNPLVSNTTVVYLDISEPEYDVTFSDGTIVRFDVLHRTRRSIADVLRMLAFRGLYLARLHHRRRMQVALAMAGHRRLGVNSPMHILSPEVLDLVLELDF